MTTTITKAEAVRQAILNGKDRPREGALYIQEKFGLFLAPSTFATYKSQIKRGMLRPVDPASATAINTTELALKVKELANVYGLEAIQQVVTVASFWKQ